jgi:hypothetical protein
MTPRDSWEVSGYGGADVLPQPERMRKCRKPLAKCKMRYNNRYQWMCVACAVNRRSATPTDVGQQHWGKCAQTKAFELSGTS